MDLGLSGKKAVVTGGERGIGREICLSLAKEGVDLAYCDIKIESGEDSTQEEIRKFGRKAFAMEVDVSDEDQVVRFVQATIGDLGSIDIFVSNAGIIECHGAGLDTVWTGVTSAVTSIRCSTCPTCITISPSERRSLIVTEISLTW